MSDVNRQVNQICDLFEDEWKSATRPLIEGYLVEKTEPLRSALFKELLAVELEYRCRAGDRPSVVDYVRRFPEDASIVSEVLDASVHSNASSIETEPQPLENGSLLGDYEIIGGVPIGQGGMGEVWKARHRTARNVVALKVIKAKWLLKKSAAEREHAIERFRIEVQASAALEHDHIVRLYHVGESNGLLYYTMQFIDGQSLDDRIKAHQSTLIVNDAQASTDPNRVQPQADPKPRHGTAMTPINSTVPNRLAAECLEQASRALHFAHNRGLLHRDIKPANMLLEKATNRIYVADFGLAKLVDSRPESHVAFERSNDGPQLTYGGVGTPGYMAPEQESDARDATVQSDVYSLGATLCALLTGQPPQLAAESTDDLNQVFKAEPQKLSISRDLQSICLTCLRPDPRLRYVSAEALADDLRRFLKGEPVSVRPVSTIRRSWLWCKRKPLIASLSMVLLLSVLTGLVVSTTLWLQAEEQFRNVEQSFQLATRVMDLMNSAIDERLSGNLEGAATLYGQCEATLERHLKDHPDDMHATQVRARLLRNHGNLLDNMGNQEQAVKLLQEAVKHITKVTAANSSDSQSQSELAETLSIHAVVLRKLNRFDEALKTYQSALRIYVELVRANPESALIRNGLARVQNNLGLLHDMMGQHADAIGCLKDAVETRKQLVASEPDNRYWASDLANSNLSLGRHLDESGDFVQAAERYLDALGLLQDAARRFGHDAELQSRLAKVQQSIGVMHIKSGNHQEALKALQASFANYQQLHEQTPASVDFRLELAATLGNMGIALQQTKEAADAFRQAIIVQKELVQLVPTRVAFREDLAAGYENLAIILRSLGSLDEADEYFRRSADEIQMVDKLRPNDPRIRNRLGRAVVNIATLQLDRKQPEQARLLFDKAVEIHRALVKNHAGQVAYESDLADVLDGLAQSLVALKQFSEASVAMQDAIKHQQVAFNTAPQVVVYRRRLSQHYQILASAERELGHTDEAVAAALERRKLWPANSNELYKVACELALCIPIVKSDSKYSLNEDKANRCKELADLAIEVLQQAIATGFDDFDHAKQDTDLDSLRSQPAFERLLSVPPAS